ncbi:MAG: sigma-70 family RNA polymerase sigma factor [Gammaproteobacteria bacterium]|nr:sigma-70 family RNA polymerase sigma factor [Gammaproteobacteria bacterium]
MGQYLKRNNYSELSKILPQLRRFSYGLSGSMAVADDLVQTACERLLSYPEILESSEGTRQWLYRAIRNLHIDAVRHQVVVSRHQDEVKQHHNSSYDDSVDIDNQLELEQIEVLIQKLPEAQRSALLMVSVEGLSYQEAAAVADIPIGTLTSRVARARVQLIGFLADSNLTDCKEGVR